ncbi:MAG: Zn-ribbon domain-containing OB-fold protein [Betaproteobacteria bacterium]|nr:Zn-ribbon domain-containing OB-fold protein [Betaproteobacteria bacterium]
MSEKTVSKNAQAKSDLGPDAFYFDALKRGKFLIQACNDCKKHIFFPRVACPHCGSSSLAWVFPSGNGTVYSTTYMTRKPEDGGDYNVAIIRLDEGVQMMSRVDKVAPAKVTIGMRVRAVIRQENDKPLLVFEPVVQS